MANENVSPRRIAVFDVDRTLLVRTSGEVQLIRFLRKRKMFPILNFPRSVVWMIRKLRLGFSEAVLRNKVYFSGLNVQEVSSFLPEFFRDYIQPRISARVVDCMKKLQKNGYEIMLLSGTLDFILDLFVDHLGADFGLGTTLEVREGKFTGSIVGEYPYFRGKVRALRHYFNGRKIDFHRSFSFADSWADIPLLRLFGHPVAVNPGRILKRKAKKEGWRVMEDKDANNHNNHQSTMSSRKQTGECRI
ncbi:MAG: HAD-IB family hydrolase [bacterium]